MPLCSRRPVRDIAFFNDVFPWYTHVTRWRVCQPWKRCSLEKENSSKLQNWNLSNAISIRTVLWTVHTIEFRGFFFCSLFFCFLTANKLTKSMVPTTCYLSHGRLQGAWQGCTAFVVLCCISAKMASNIHTSPSEWCRNHLRTQILNKIPRWFKHWILNRISVFQTR